ncbi:MAG: MetS family NSS transporter small subunit [Actinomycetota bacterium]
MSAGAWIMLLFGMVFLWGGLIYFTVHYLRAARNNRRSAS